MKILKALKPGLFTTVQDLGRFGYLRYGVPISGAMDTFSHTIANLLVDNSPAHACLEMTLIGAELQALTETQIALAGGEISAKINDVDAPMWQTLNISEGDIISFGRMRNGCRVYLAVRGGVDVPLVLGSRSTYVRGGFGGIEGRQLKAEDTVDGFRARSVTKRFSMLKEQIPQFADQVRVHVILGPQDDMFTEKGVETFLSNQYEITLEADRMGYRLEGPVIEHKGKADIVSDALLPGAIQVPKSGKPIVIMRDAQTTGGYPKIAAVATSDVWRLGQAKPSITVSFEKITMKEGYEKFLKYDKLLVSVRDAIAKNRTSF
jgi:biotin-dependent carboxylase-like uncharacterized protein